MRLLVDLIEVRRSGRKRLLPTQPSDIPGHLEPHTGSREQLLSVFVAIMQLLRGHTLPLVVNQVSKNCAEHQSPTYLHLLEAIISTVHFICVKAVP